jgi:hypothetical protein
MTERESEMQQSREFIMKNFAFFKDLYQTKKEMLSYCEKFQGTRETLTISDFLAIHEYYKTMKQMNNSTVKLVMIISLIEKLCSERKYVDFAQWLKEREHSSESEYCKSEHKCCRKMWNEYNQEYGSSGKFQKFFENQQYVTRDDQIALVRSVETYIKKSDGSLSLMNLLCHEATCPEEEKEVDSNLGRVRAILGCDYQKCPLLEDDKKLKMGIGDFTGLLYEIRNRFVHNAVLTQFPSGKMSRFNVESHTISMKELRFRKTERRARTLRATFPYGAEQLETILNHSFKQLLDAYIASNAHPARSHA